MMYLDQIKTALLAQLKNVHGQDPHYYIPQAWMPESLGAHGTISVNPYRFFLESIGHIEKSNLSIPRCGDAGEWSREAVIYNLFVRTTCAFDHDQNGKLDLPANGDGFREVGTFLKALALLPHIHQLGANTVHLLPITSIGKDGNKGNLGSPYAIKNPYKLDETLSEPSLGVGAEVEFGAFVEAAHRLGIRVVVEFVFRTGSKDSDWILEHPEWFYWIRADIPDRAESSLDESRYGAPVFSSDELRHITAVVDQNRLDSLLRPHDIHRAMFTPPPTRDAITIENGKFIGKFSNGTRVRIPGAFADWPPNDAQPPWGDVTYLKLYNHPDFNYMSYDTVRMYNVHLARPENINHELWERIIGIIPHYQKTFGIDGVMIDMGHALPMDLKRAMVHAARSNNPDFAFWDENFAVTEKSRQEGYNAVIGYCWIDQHKLQKFRKLLERCGMEEFPIPFFATPESHNTPRTAARSGGMNYSKVAWFLDNFLPAIPFIHSGFELGEQLPINTGLDFALEELKLFPPSKLPLFSEASYDWAKNSPLVEWVSKVSELRKNYEDLVINPDPNTFRLLNTGNEKIIAFTRTSPDKQRMILVMANYDPLTSQQGRIDIGMPSMILEDRLSGKKIYAGEGKLNLHLQPGACLLLVH